MPLSDSAEKLDSNTSTTQLTSGPTFKATILPLFQKYCLSCHAGYSKYDTAFKKRDSTLQRVVVDKNMPTAQPGKAMTDQERDLIKQWVNAGAPSGEEAPVTTATATPIPAAVVVPVPTESTAEVTKVTYKSNILPLFQASAAKCHDADGFGNYLDYKETYAARKHYSATRSCR